MEINVLWIEDEKEWLSHQIRELKRKLTPDFTLNVMKTNHGERLAKYLSRPLDFVVCDYRLKEGDEELSARLVKKTRHQNRYCKIIFYSGSAFVPPEVIRQVARSGVRYVDRVEVVDVMLEELEHGLSVYALIDKWLTYYQADARKIKFPALGREFKNKNVHDLIRDVRKGTSEGSRFAYELTKYMLSMISG